MQTSRRNTAWRAVLVSALLLSGVRAKAAESLVLERKIPLGHVVGRIDHLAIDLARKRMFVVELGNQTLGVVDLVEGKLLYRITGLNKPQGVGYVPNPDTIFVADGGDGAVHLFKGSNFVAIGTNALGKDADNVRVNLNDNQVVVGYGEGALAFINGRSGASKGSIRLPGHPESFQLDRLGTRAFVNVPDAGQIAVLDLHERRQVAAWTVPHARENFPMALDESGNRLAVVFRTPSLLAILDLENGRVLAELPTCGDSDDVFFDHKRHRLYISCGQGAVAIVHEKDSTFRELERLPTVVGARTSLFVPELDRFVLAVRASESERAALWVFRPTP